jgi:hypothetical protein
MDTCPSCNNTMIEQECPSDCERKSVPHKHLYCPICVMFAITSGPSAESQLLTKKGRKS